jgi:hypothetical protein
VSPLDLLVDVAATARLTRLVTLDEVSAPVRDWAWRSGHRRTTYLVNCPHCVSVWAGLAVSLVLPRPIRRALALSQAVVLLSDRSPRGL